MIRIVIVAIVMLAVGLVAVRYVEAIGHAPAAVVATKADPVPASANSRAMTIRAGQGGHFEVEARVDGRRMEFLIDTGASQIALRASDAARLGFHPSPRDYSVKLMTANGEGRAARMQLRMVEVGNIIVRDLPALVTPDEMLAVNLLGMSFLSRMRWSHERGKLILEQ